MLNVFSYDSSIDDYTQIARDATTLENISTKITGDISSKSRANFTYFRGNKLKFGRGASGFRPDETTYNQDGPTDLFKFEFNQTIGTNLFIVGRYAHTKNGFSLEPRGGRDVQSYRDDSQVYHGSYGWALTNRPQDNVSLEGNMFKGRHDLKFGFGWRKASVTSESGWPGNGVRTYHRGVSKHAGASRSRLRAVRRGQVLERVPRRHDQPRSVDDQRRRALGSFGELGCAPRQCLRVRHCPI